MGNKYILIMLSTTKESNPTGQSKCPTTEATLCHSRGTRQCTTRGKWLCHSRARWDKTLSTQKLTPAETIKSPLLGRRKVLLSGTPAKRKRNAQKSMLQQQEKWQLQRKRQPQPINPECLQRTQNKVLRSHLKVRKMPERLLLPTRRRRKRREKVRKGSSNNQRWKVTVALTA